MQDGAPTLNLRRFAMASLVPLAVMIVALVVKPLWRDEYWSLFFADPALSLGELFHGRWRDEVHPPLYYIILHGWRQLIDHPVAMRLLSPTILAITAALLLRSPAARDRRTLLTFLLVSLGSYWVIYFATEIRGYTLLFCLVAGSIALLPALLERERLRWTVALVWVLVGAGLSLTHYFGALWFCCLGLVSGLCVLRQGRWSRFVTIGLLTGVALLPLLAWLAWSLPVLDLSDEMTQRGLGEKFASGIQQFSRGLFVKTALSNPLVTALGFGGLAGALLLRDRMGAVLIHAALLCTVIAFGLQLFAVELIKERAFIVIMPAILFVLSARLSRTRSSWARWVPLVAAVMPLLFTPEYFKNREGIPDMRDYLATHADACAGEPVLAFYRESLQTEFYPQATRSVVQGWGREPVFDPQLIDARAAQSIPLAAPQTDCPVRAVGVLLSRQSEETQAIDRVLRAAGLDPDELDALAFGKGRNRVWVDKSAGQAAE